MDSDVAARPTNLAISVVNLAAGLGCEVANLTSLPALRLTLFLTSIETDHVFYSIGKSVLRNESNRLERKIKNEIQNGGSFDAGWSWISRQ